MAMVKSIIEKVKWFFLNLPVVSTTLFIVMIVCYKIRLDRHFSDVALCVQPHMVMTGQVSRVIKYVVHHKNLKHLVLSLAALGVFGTVAERQAGSFRFLVLTTMFAILSAIVTVFFSILLGFSSLYSSLMYSCPALGILPAMFSIIVLVFRSFPLKKTVIFFLMLPNTAIPWLLLIMSHFILQDNVFISNLSGCIVGSLYLVTSRTFTMLSADFVRSVDYQFMKIFKFIPVIKYIAGASEELPVYNSEKSQLGGEITPHYPSQNDGIEESGVPQYKVDQLVKMGYQKEESIVALTAANHNVEQAASILSEDQVGPHASVVAMQS